MSKMDLYNIQSEVKELKKLINSNLKEIKKTRFPVGQAIEIIDSIEKEVMILISGSEDE